MLVPSLSANASRHVMVGGGIGSSDTVKGFLYSHGWKEGASGPTGGGCKCVNGWKEGASGCTGR
eukprot:2317091-Karenia_brevis.AAC.1